MIELISKEKGEIQIAATDILLKRKSPLFSTDSIIGDITFPFTIPLTDELREWLNHPDRPESINEKSLKSILLKRNGRPILMGDLRIGDANKDTVETTLLTGSTPFAALIKDYCLDDLNIGSQTFESEAEMLSYFNSTINGNAFTHPYYLPTIESPETGHLNLYYDNTYSLTHSGDDLYIAPMLYYSWLLPKLFEAFGLEFEDKVFANNSDLNEMLFFSLHNINSQEDKLTIQFKDLLPHYKVSTWLIDIQNALGVRFLFEHNKQKVTLDWQVNALKNLSKAKRFPHSKIIIKDTDATPRTFNHALIDAQGIWGIPEVMRPAVWKKADLPKADDFRWKIIYVIEEDLFYLSMYSYENSKFIISTYYGVPGVSFNNAQDPIDRLFFLHNFSVGDTPDRKLEINSHIHPLHRIKNTTYHEDEHLQNFTYVESDAKAISPYILFAKHATDTGTNWVNSDYYLNDVSLTWETSRWLLRNKLLPWFEFLKNAKTIETFILINDIDLANWDWTIPIKIGNVPVLVDEMEIQLSAESELMKTKIRAYIM